MYKTDKEKIRAFIEKRYNYHKDHADDYAGTEHFWKADEDRELLSFIDSMQKEPVSEDLEQAAKNYMRSQNPPIWGLYYGFKAGAQWQKRQITVL